MNNDKLNLAYLAHLGRYASALADGYCEILGRTSTASRSGAHSSAIDAVHRLLSVMKQVNVAIELCHRSQRRQKPHVIDNILGMIASVEEDLNGLRRTLGFIGGPKALVSYSRVAA